MYNYDQLCVYVYIYTPVYDMKHGEGLIALIPNNMNCDKP